MEQLIAAVLKWMQAAGFSAVRGTPKGFWPELPAPVTAVSMGKSEAEQAGLFSYLGVMEEKGKYTALYGKRLKAEVKLQTFSPESLGLDACAQEADRIITALSGGIAGLTVTGFTTQPCAYDEDADCFCITTDVQVQAYLYALANEDETEFTDFILKGEVQ